MYQDGIFWNIEFHATQTSKRMKHPVIKTSGHPNSPSKPNKTNMPAQFTRSDTGSEMPFIFFFPVLSLNVSANVEAPFGKEKLKQIFPGPGEKRSSHLGSHQAMVVPLGVSMLSKGLLQYLSKREYNFCGVTT